jgi:hypothetical protein
MTVEPKRLLEELGRFRLLFIEIVKSNRLWVIGIKGINLCGARKADDGRRSSDPVGDECLGAKSKVRQQDERTSAEECSLADWRR